MRVTAERTLVFAAVLLVSGCKPKLDAMTDTVNDGVPRTTPTGYHDLRPTMPEKGAWIWASPCSGQAGSKTCTASIQWSGGPKKTCINYRVNGGALNRFACGNGTGSASAPWIDRQSSTEFLLAPQANQNQILARIVLNAS